MTILALALAAATAVHAGELDAKIDAKKLYTAKCASCHAATGTGNPAMAKMFKTDAAALDLTDADTQKESDADLAKTISGGKNKMPAFKGKLKDDEIAGLTGYLRSLAKPAAKKN